MDPVYSVPGARFDIKLKQQTNEAFQVSSKSLTEVKSLNKSVIKGTERSLKKINHQIKLSNQNQYSKGGKAS